MYDLNGKTALITGAASGIGRAIGLKLAAAGANVVLTDVNEAGLKESAGLARDKGGKAIVVVHDVSDEAQWLVALDAAQEAFGNLHFLVNNAGISPWVDLFSTSLETFQRVMAINAQGAFLGMKHAIPRIAASSGGSVVNISSMAGLVGLPNLVAYGASKGAVRMMTKAVALECAQLRNNVRVNSIHPGLVDTPAFARLAEQLQTMGGADEAAKTLVPIGEACQPEQVASLVEFLCSPGARHITGAELAIDGGMTAG